MRKSTVFRTVHTDDTRIGQKAQMHLDNLTAKLQRFALRHFQTGDPRIDVDLKPA
jgi:hypothetical protein